MKITKQQLRRIIREENQKLLKEDDEMQMHTIFDDDYLYELLADEVEKWMRSKGPEGPRRLVQTHKDRMKRAIDQALYAVFEDYGE